MRITKYLLCSMVLAFSTAMPAHAQQAHSPYASTQYGQARLNHTAQKTEIYVVMFRADWCGPCKIVEPALDLALRDLNDHSIKPIIIDITTPAVSERSAHLAFDHNIVRQYNEWMGVTGFAAIIDADTKSTLGCVNMTYDVGAMRAHIKNLKTYAAANKTSFDITCPAPNPPVL